MRVKFVLILGVLLTSLMGCASTIPLETVLGEEEVSLNDTLTDTITICSFNIQFLGHFKDRENELLADMLQSYDLVVIQELVAPPVDGKYPDGESFSKDNESLMFHEEMLGRGFQYWLSEEDTGPTKNHTGSSASEWWIVYYRDMLVPDTISEPYGFLSDTLVGNHSFERVPYSFAFRSAKGNTSFNLISVHLNPGGSSADMSVRKRELNAINHWINLNEKTNKDFIILGDCNIEKKEELTDLESSVFDSRYHSLNEDCQSTNTKIYESEEKGKPYDHVFVTEYSDEDIVSGSFKVVDLRKFIVDQQMETFYFPYDHNSFRTRVSDHMPVTYQLVLGKDTD